MVHPIITGIATGIGLLTDKYMLGATNFVEHYAVEFHATDAQKDFVKAAMYGGAILGMIVMGPLSDIIGRPGHATTCHDMTTDDIQIKEGRESSGNMTHNILFCSREPVGICWGRRHYRTEEYVL